MHILVITELAQRELDQAHDWWAENRSRAQADRWYGGFIREILSLESDPLRCPLAPESDQFQEEVRQLNYGIGGRRTHRALFVVRETTIVILRVRHLAQQPLGAGDL